MDVADHGRLLEQTLGGRIINHPSSPHGRSINFPSDTPSTDQSLQRLRVDGLISRPLLTASTIPISKSVDDCGLVSNDISDDSVTDAGLDVDGELDLTCLSLPSRFDFDERGDVEDVEETHTATTPSEQLARDSSCDVTCTSTAPNFHMSFGSSIPSPIALGRDDSVSKASSD